MSKAERWCVRLLLDGKTHTQVAVTIRPPFGIRRADAEVKAIKEAQASGHRAQALDSWPLDWSGTE